MKSITALTTATAALATTLITGALCFAPAASTASFAPDTTPGQVAVYVTDDEGDGIEKVKVLVSDADNPTAKPVDTKSSGAGGHLEVKFPKGGLYIVHIDTPPDPTQFDEGNDTDEGTLYRCGGKVLSRCITVKVENGVVHFPGQTAATPAMRLDMRFADREHEPRVEVVVELEDHRTTLIAGGKITITPVTDDPTNDRDNPPSMDGKGRTRSRIITSKRYNVTFTPPPGYSLADPKRQTRNEHVTKLTEVRYVVVPNTMSGAENTSIHIEPDQQLDSVGGQDPALDEEAALDEVLDILGGNNTDARKEPGEEAPAVPVETIPVDSPTIVDPPPAATVPVETIPVDTVPVETIPVDPPPAATVPVETVPPTTDELTAECIRLLEMYPAVTEIDPGLFGACEASPVDAITIINELLGELGA